MNTATLTVHGVLAGCYKGGRKGELLTHYATDESSEDAICGRVQPGGLCDLVEPGPPSCPVCVRKAAKLGVAL